VFSPGHLAVETGAGREFPTHRQYRGYSLRLLNPSGTSKTLAFKWVNYLDRKHRLQVSLG
jgi:hypothetical protein